MYNLRNQQIDFDFKPQYITEEVHNGKLQRSRTEVGDLIMNIVGPPLGKLAIIPPTLPQANFNQAAVLIRPYLYKGVINHYLKSYFEEMSEINSITTRGCAGQVNISLSQSQNMRIPLPPLAEQRRIVTEIEREFSLIEIIENGEADLKSAVRQAKAKILELAIHGKLVPQNPADEPASDLLRRINPKAENTSDNAQYGKIPFDVPESWEWTMLGDLFETISSKRVSKTDWQSEGIPFYRAREIVQLDKDGIADKDLFITQQLYTELKTKYGVPEDGDIMISAVGSIGSTYIVKANDVFYYKDASVLCLRNINRLNPSFFKIWLSTPFVQGQMKDNSKGTTVDTITLGKLNAYKIPLPPIAEQHRIVAKIEQLFTQLDNIEAEL